MSDVVKNTPQDLDIKFQAETYEFIEDLLNKDTKDVPLLMFMLSLLGLINTNKVELTKASGYGSHQFSLRTMYNKYESDFDAYFGLIAILDNINEDYDVVINKIAFERTGLNNTPFLKMKNVKTFFEYMLGGIEIFDDKFLSYGRDSKDIVDSIHDFLTDESIEIDNLIRDLLLQEEDENGY